MYLSMAGIVALAASFPFTACKYYADSEQVLSYVATRRVHNFHKLRQNDGIEDFCPMHDR